MTVLAVGNDEILIGTLKILCEAGMRVDQDISMITFDNADPLDLLGPPVTAIRQAIEQTGKKAIERLMPRFQDEERVTVREAI